MTPKRKMQEVHLPAMDLPLAAEADVVVVGGGTSGFIAAVAAARSGARTLLLEQGGFLGGALTATYVSNPGHFGDSEGRQIIGGIPWEAVERLEKEGLALVDRERFKVQVLPEGVKGVAIDMVMEAGVRLFLYSPLGWPLVNEGLIEGLVVLNKSGPQVVRGRVYIDATGDGDLAFRAGAPFEQNPPEALWQTSLDLTVANVDAERLVRWAEQHPGDVLAPEMDYSHRPEGIQPMFTLLIPNTDTRMDLDGIIHRGPMPTVKLLIQRSLGRVQGSVEIDPTDGVQVTHAAVEGRRRAMAHLAFLRVNVPGFEKAIIVGESFLGVRESRRISGEYRLTLDDLLSNARFPDVVLLNARALDRHTTGERFRITYLKGNHDVPYRALIPRKLTNLLVAGRCLSCDHEAHASLRGAATCMAMGHAAGCAAALAAAVDGRVRSVSVAQLQAKLVEQGAILKVATD